MMIFLVGYDISKPKRLNKVHRVMVNFATPLQYSIFLFEGSKKEMQSCLKIVSKLINPKEDDIRFYQLPKRGFQCRFGKAIITPGIVWTIFPPHIQ